MFSSTIAVLRERWQSILAATLVSGLLVVVLAFVLLIPTIGSLVPDAAPAPAEFGTVDTPIGFDGTGASFDASGLPATTGDLGGATSEVSAPQAPGLGGVLMLFVAMGLVMAASIATATTGVFAAAGHGWKEALVEGARTSPHAIVQSFLLTWKAIAAYVVGILLGVVVGFPLGALFVVVGFIAGFVLALKVIGAAYVAIGSIAHGHVTWQPDAARAAVAGREWNATGVGIVGTIVASVLSMIPFAGPLFMSAFTSAMWTEFGEDSPSGGAPTAPGDDGSAAAAATLGVPANAASVAAAAAAAGQGEAGAADPAAVEPAAAAGALPEQATGQLVAGPGWNAMATTAEPSGQWLQLAKPAAVAVQVQWTTGEPPAIQHADQAGTWSAAPTQPTTSGDSVWLQLGAGWTWIAVVPRGAEQQQLWIQTWLPQDAVATAAA